ncbi:sister chromatid cohesion protein PDS5 homolog D-like isoform X3 [Nicotiana tomentosiformis]|uniref:sister chromatid cohesion protein PDS5 homolog D-like isoform X3 n=1 Tax=Nicotiana tomentosiformis TaxID=4098 RepID=UPI00388C997E
MAASCSCTASQKEVEDKLTAYGMKLMNPPSSIDDLRNFLHRVESLLKMVGQCPSDSMKSALQPVMNALIEKELLRHNTEDVKVLVICCITELFRITAPRHPYDDDRQMEEILQRTVMALKKLSDVSGCIYYKVVQILEIVAKVRAFVMLLDFECDTLVIEIFKLFLGIIRPYHPHNVFTKMEEIMTQLIEDSDELSVELLRPILDSVKKENQIASPVSSKLGEKVLEKCAAIVKPYLAEALKSMSLNPDDCAEIVASICNEMPKGEQMMANENAPDTRHPIKVGQSDSEFCEPALQDDTHMEQLKVTCTMNVMKPVNPEDVQPATNAEVVSRRSSELTGSGGQHSSASKKPEISNGSHGHWDQPKKKEILTNEDAHLGVLVPEGDVLQSQVKKKGSLHLGLTGEERTKHTVCAKRNQGRSSRKNEFASNYDADSKSEFSTKSEEGNISDYEEPSLELIDGRKKKKKRNSFKMLDFDDSGDEATKLSVRYENNLNGCANYQPWRKLTTGKHEVLYDDGDIENLILHEERWEMLEDNSSQKDSKRRRNIKRYGEELVGARIKVWCPLDEEFYEAIISSFDHVKKRHKVVHVDGEVEILKLHNERWEMLEDNSSQKDNEINIQGHAVSSVTESDKTPPVKTYFRRKRERGDQDFVSLDQV